MKADLTATLLAAFGEGRVQRDVPLAPFTTFKVGGPAQWFVETRTRDEMVTALKLAHVAGVPVVLLGGGSNVLVADRGVRALVVHPRGGGIEFRDPCRVRADAAVTINGLVRWAVTHGVGGIEEWAGTPGTVGGAVYGNAHFGGRLISEAIASVQVADSTGRVEEVAAANMSFGYDRSRLQTTGEIVLAADFVVSPGDSGALREKARQSLAYRKRTQPLHMPSAGCVFQNPMPGHDSVPDGMSWSAGALVDRAGMKGASVGGASVSSTHGNFIVNDGHATAADIRQLIALCRDAVQRQFGVVLRDEIVCLGDFSNP